VRHLSRSLAKVRGDGKQKAEKRWWFAELATSLKVRLWDA